MYPQYEPGGDSQIKDEVSYVFCSFIVRSRKYNIKDRRQKSQQNIYDYAG